MVAAADKGKRSKVEDGVESSDPVDGELVLAIEKLQEVQDELEKISEEASDKVLEVEQKYSEIRKPIYSKRNEIIQSIPDFWLTAFLSHPALSDLLNKEDEKILKHLVSLDVDHSDVKAGYSITFNFSPNPYFEDTKLTKSFSYSDEGTTSVTGTTIKWKEGMNIANGVAHEKKGKKRPIAEQRLVSILDFFSWFGETQDKSPSSMIFDEVAEIIKEDLWPNPLKYFNNEADEDDFEEDEEDDEDDDEEDEVVCSTTGEGLR
ncbi:NAP1-related protein 2-like isoform X2 [Dioscorea cayenensis subsp. rotundata]|uniref:NAP1-related protein 2-like isoform X2 n=1 Tax=Dioscorea cayennensis subsp. rotundata TaxID=55577 RepID=A0AB40BFD3_DIOCR|nr:NAP1-related protein 2-like isoform X2 [Dioscorea cayenensis subsp. rotundata]